MKRWLLSLILTFVLATQSFAQITLSKEHLVENFGPGYCAWCSIEVLGRYHGVKKLFDLAKNRSLESDGITKEWNGTKWVETPYVLVEYNGYFVREKRNPGSDYAVYRKLNSLGVKYRKQWSGNYSHDLINYAMKNKLGCSFAVKPGVMYDKASAHAMVLLNIDSKSVEIFDPNDIENTYIYNREWFNKSWTGWLVVIEKVPENHKHLSCSSWGWETSVATIVVGRSTEVSH